MCIARPTASTGARAGTRPGRVVWRPCSTRRLWCPRAAAGRPFGMRAAAVPEGGGRAWPGFEPTRQAEGSRRGRRAGGPPPSGAESSWRGGPPALRGNDRERRPYPSAARSPRPARTQQPCPQYRGVHHKSFSRHKLSVHPFLRHLGAPVKRRLTAAALALIFPLSMTACGS